MKKLTLSLIIGAVMSTTAVAGDIQGGHNSNISADFSKLDNDGNGHITKAELKAANSGKFLKKMDADGNEKVTQSEFDKYVKNNPSMFSKDVVTRVETNGTTDAVLTRKMTTSSSQSMSEPMIAGSGATMEKGKEMMGKEMSSEMKAKVTAKFNKADSNDDGKLSMMEVKKAGIEGDFGEMDKDDNQLLTKMEFRQHLTH
ncbi:EF-hand domain-containing protein [Alteromonas sp. 1_MG-2023]|uniref:EF-hand domain-containing protein n=1 Tax=Alteromonas sp. 1_MG-2023 TaxID=3062669 RepID=UPI0026E3D409|nr:EF-hand domain-containing protein [Alteromonas sp. 1_MG-2023]MDO6567393.1 EF-hand domain-containing protein [Alteromonas sp. 1_MG-2023]